MDGPVGRVNELEQMRCVLDAQREDASFILLTGPAGVGKSTLWEWACREAVADRLVLRCRATEAESGLPYVSLGDLLRDIPADLWADVPAAQRGVLDAVSGVADSDIAPDARVIGLALLTVVDVVGRSGPLLLAIDDAQWLDRASHRVLNFALRRLAQGPVVVLIAQRSDALSTVLDLDPSTQLAHIEVGPVGLDDLRSIIVARLGVRLPFPTLRRVHETCAGNPFFGLEMARHLIHRPAPPGEPFAVPERLTDLVRRRLDALSPERQRVLAAAAAMSRPRVDILAAVVGEEAALGALDAAQDHDLVHVHGNLVEFAHPLLVSSLYASLPNAELREVHAALADHVAEPEEQAKHLALARPGVDPEVAATLEAAAEHARSRGAPAIAADLFRLSCERTPPGHDAALARRLLGTAVCTRMSGDLEAAEQAASLALGLVAEGTPERGAALLELSETADTLVGAIELLRRAVAETGDRAALVEAHSRLAWEYGIAGELQVAVEHAEAAVELAEGLGDPNLLAEALCHLVNSRFRRGLGLQGDLLERALELHDPPTTTTGALPPAGVATHIFVWAGDLDQAGRYLDLWRTAAEVSGSPYDRSSIGFYEAMIHLRTGRWHDALDALAANQRLAEHLGLVAGGAAWSVLMSIVEARLGELDLAEAHALRALDESADDEWLGTMFTRANLGFIAISRGDLAAAYEVLAPLPEIAAGFGLEEPGFTAGLVADAVEAAVGVGELDEAAAWQGWLASCSQRVDRPLGTATERRCAGLIALGRGAPEDAAGILDDAVDLTRPLGHPFELGRTLLLAGAAHRRLKAKSAARERLETARQIFQQLSAPHWVAKSEDELRKISGRAPSRWELTPAEADVARLVAGGRTNREVAETLFISPKTVEWNLSKVYRKLGVRSRTELAATWQDDGPDQRG